MLQENKPDAACMYVHTLDTSSDRHVLGLLLCAGVTALVLCCAVLYFAVLAVVILSDNILVHTTAVLLLLYTGTT